MQTVIVGLYCSQLLLQTKDYVIFLRAALTKASDLGFKEPFGLFQ